MRAAAASALARIPHACIRHAAHLMSSRAACARLRSLHASVTEAPRMHRARAVSLRARPSPTVACWPLGRGRLRRSQAQPSVGSSDDGCLAHQVLVMATGWSLSSCHAGHASPTLQAARRCSAAAARRTGFGRLGSACWPCCLRTGPSQSQPPSPLRAPQTLQRGRTNSASGSTTRCRTRPPPAAAGAHQRWRMRLQQPSRQPSPARRPLQRSGGCSRRVPSLGGAYRASTSAAGSRSRMLAAALPAGPAWLHAFKMPGGQG